MLNKFQKMNDNNTEKANKNLSSKQQKSHLKQQKAKQMVEKLLSYADIQVNGDRPWDMQVHNEQLFARLLQQGSLGLGESYMDGWWDAIAVDALIERLLLARIEKKIVFDARVILLFLTSKLFNYQRKSRAVQVAEKHYNLDNELYSYMLGESMSYTCAYFKDTDELDVAQNQKHELICQKLKLSSKDRVLELGCGWGGFAKYAATHYGCEVTAINISSEQVKFANAACQDLPVHFHLCDYRDEQVFNPNGETFDKIVSIGLCEHIGYKNYKSLFTLANKSLKKDGIFLLHTIGGNRSKTSIEPWTNKYIFPNAMLPSIKQLGAAMQGLFVMEDWHNFGVYYDTTLMAWHDNFIKSWDKIQDRYDQRFKRMWSYYLLSCAGMFRARDAQLWQIVLTKEGFGGGYQSVR